MSPANKVSGCMKFVAGHPQAAGPARRHLRPEQPADPRAGDRRRCRRVEGRVCRVEARARPRFIMCCCSTDRSRTVPMTGASVSPSATSRPDLKQAVGQRDWATLVRGKDTYGHFEPEYVPKRDLEPEALAFHKAVIGRAGARALSRHRQDRLSRATPTQLEVSRRPLRRRQGMRTSRSRGSGRPSEYGVGGSDVVPVIQLGCRGLSHQRNQQSTNQTFGAPVEQRPALRAATRCWRSRFWFRILATSAYRTSGPPLSSHVSLQEIRLHFPAQWTGGRTAWRGRHTSPNW